MEELRIYVLDENYDNVLLTGEELDNHLAFNKFCIEFNTKRGHPPYGNPRVGYNIIGEYTISTVMLPFDHGFRFNVDDNEPQLFESIVFDSGLGDEESEEIKVRYSTYAEALEGHNKLVDKIRYKTR